MRPTPTRWAPDRWQTSTVSGGTLKYFAATDSALNIGGNLTITGGTGTAIGGTIGAAAASAKINVAGVATATGNVAVDVRTLSSAPAPGTYTVIQGGIGSSLDGAIYSLAVYNNASYTIATPAATATELTVSVGRRRAAGGRLLDGWLCGRWQHLGSN